MKKRMITLLLTSAMVIGSLAGCGAVNTGESSAPAAESSALASDNAQQSEAAPASDNTQQSEAAPAATTADTEGTQASPEFYATADLSVLKDKKIGITIQDLGNAYWAGVMTALTEQIEAAGAEVTIVDCKDNSATQIGQIENFVSSGCDLIMIHPSDANAVEDAAKEARDAGIKVMCWDDPMTNTDGNWILDNTALGIEIGNLAGEFINEHFSESDKAEVAVLGYPQTKVLLERENGIKEGLENTAGGKYEIVASQPALVPNEAQTAVETILQKNPDLDVVVGIGAGPMIGANEALVTYTNGDVPETMGVFTTDVTKQQLEQLKAGDQASKGIIGFEGSDVDTAKACEAMFALILGEKLETQNVLRNVAPITIENADKIMAEMK